MNTNTIKIRGNKNKILAISLIAIFAISVLMTFAPAASAQIPFPNPRTTAGYISVSPLVIGVGQTATVNAWVCPLPQDYALTSYYNLQISGGSYTGITATFTKPDGTKDTITPTDGVGTYPAGVLDALGTTYFYYTPNMAGNWSVTMSMPAQNFTDQTGTVQWKACTSQPAYFTVTTEQQNAGLLNGWPYSPLPNSNVYWNYPISSNNREWSAISGDWLQQGISVGPEYLNVGVRWQAYGPGPSTPHILWDIPWSVGGIIGGALGDISNMVTGPYSGNSPIIMEGKLYLNVLPASYSAAAKQFECIDLKTGKILWTQSGFITGGIHQPGNVYAQAVPSSNNPSGGDVNLASSYGKSPFNYLFQSTGGANGPGGEPTTVWNYYDINTGALMKSVTNVTASDYEFVDDSVLAWGCTALQVNTTTFIYAQNYVWEWNATKVVGGDWYTGLIWKHIVNNPAKGIPGPGDGSDRYSLAMSADGSSLVYGGGAGANLVEGFNAQTGASIWNLTLPDSAQIGMIQLSLSNNFLEYIPTFATFSCYSCLTGALIWSSPNVGAYPWNTKYGTSTCVNDFNNVYIGLPNGAIVALSLATGNTLWSSAPVPSTEYTTNALGVGWLGTPILVGGNLYAYLGYLSSYMIDPIPRFAAMESVNATTGQTEWILNGGVCPTAASGGYVVGAGILDGNFYCFGKGQTSTTVSAPNNFVEGTTVQIQGTVMDLSPAQPNTHVVSDSSQSEWMDYLHMQNATLLNSPPKEQGVLVTLTAVDPNNNTVVIGTATTDSEGSFRLDWTPSMTGDYTITATFAGSGSYWPSQSETSAVVNSAPTSTSTSGQTSTATGVSTTDLYTIGAAIIVVIIIVGIAIILMQQRKRP